MGVLVSDNVLEEVALNDLVALSLGVKEALGVFVKLLLGLAEEEGVPLLEGVILGHPPVVLLHVPPKYPDGIGQRNT